MKKQLLATSALVAAGMIATAGAASAQTAPASSPIQVTVGGYMYQFLSYVHQDDRGASATTVGMKPAKVMQTSDSEIYFQGKTTLANGISVGMRIELEGNTECDQIDESFGFIDGAFGRIEAGSTFGAPFKMGYHAPEATVSLGVAALPTIQANLVVNPTTGGIGPFDNPLGATNMRQGDDASDKISYYTPRFEGFQLGVSYTPEQTQDRNHLVAFRSNTYNNGVGVALNFVRAFGPIDLAVYGGYQRFTKPSSTSIGNNATLSDPQDYGFGAQVGYAGFRFGGSYTRMIDYVGIGGAITSAGVGATTGFTGATDTWAHGRSFDVGLTYTFGPAVIGIDYMNGHNKNATGSGGGVNKQDAINVGGRYALGPGVQVQAQVFHVKYDGAQSTSFADNKATGVTTGFLLNF